MIINFIYKDIVKVKQLLCEGKCIQGHGNTIIHDNSISEIPLLGLVLWVVCKNGICRIVWNGKHINVSCGLWFISLL